MNNATFVSGLIVKTHTFANGGEVIKLSFKIPEFAAFVKENKNGDWLNIDIKTSKKGSKYAVLNEYKKESRATEVIQSAQETQKEEVMPTDLPWE